MRGERYDLFLLLEIAIRLLGIINGRHEVFPVVPTLQQSAIRCQKSQITPPVGGGWGEAYHQHPKHLTLLGIDACYLLLHLLRCQLAQGVRLIIKRIGKAFGLWDICIERMNYHRLINIEISVCTLLSAMMIRWSASSR